MEKTIPRGSRGAQKTPGVAGDDVITREGKLAIQFRNEVATGNYHGPIGGDIPHGPPRVPVRPRVPVPVVPVRLVVRGRVVALPRVWRLPRPPSISL